MNWFEQLKEFWREIQMAKNGYKGGEKFVVRSEDLEYVSSTNEGILLHPDKSASLIIWLSFGVVIILIAWSLIMPIDEVVKAHGSVVPSHHIQRLQSFDGGILKEIKVQEGEIVKKGDLLVILDDSIVSSELNDAQRQAQALAARQKALNAYLSGKRNVEIGALGTQDQEIVAQERDRFYSEQNEKESKLQEMQFAIDQKRSEYETAKENLVIAKQDYIAAQEEYNLNQEAYNQQVLPKVEFLKSQHQLNDTQRRYKQAQFDVPKTQSALNEAIKRKEGYLNENKARFARERSEVQSKLDSMQYKGEGLKEKDEHFMIYAPMDGVVKKIFRNTIGSSIKPGEDILQIVPLDDVLIVEAKVKPKDIGFIRQGLKAKVKLSAFDYATYGGLDGDVKYVSADTITDQKGNSFFIVRIQTKQNNIVDKKGKKHQIIPGMQTEADIVVDQKSIMAYLLKQMFQ